MFNILVHVSFATTYVNSQLQNYSDAKGGAMQWSPMCEAQGWSRATTELQNTIFKWDAAITMDLSGT